MLDATVGWQVWSLPARSSPSTQVYPVPGSALCQDSKQSTSGHIPQTTIDLRPLPRITDQHRPTQTTADQHGYSRQWAGLFAAKCRAPPQPMTQRYTDTTRHRPGPHDLSGTGTAPGQAPATAPAPVPATAGVTIHCGRRMSPPMTTGRVTRWLPGTSPGDVSGCVFVCRGRPRVKVCVYVPVWV